MISHIIVDLFWVIIMVICGVEGDTACSGNGTGILAALRHVLCWRDFSGFL